MTTAPRHAAPLLAAALAAAVAGCFGALAPAPGGLAYRTPDPNPAGYTFHDTAAFTIQAPGYGAMEVLTTVDGTAELSWRDAVGGYAVRVRFPELTGRFRNPAQGEVVADQSHVDGTVGVELSYTGEVVVVDTPAVSETLREITGVEALIRPFFLRLPGRSVDRGAAWSDSVTTLTQVSGRVSRLTRVTRYTVRGDTVAAGRRLLVLGLETRAELRVTGVSGGVEVDQRLRGALTGRALWDQAGHVLVERTEAGRLEGTLAIPAAGVDPIPVTARLSRRVALRP